ncbi:MAG: hypothetical protein QXI64_10220 [Sulfolobales archaeon]
MSGLGWTNPDYKPFWTWGTQRRTCWTCYGTGRCQRCRGSGIRVCPECNGLGRTLFGERCHNCRGMGQKLCSSCGGSGRCWRCNGSGEI